MRTAQRALYALAAALALAALALTVVPFFLTSAGPASRPTPVPPRVTPADWPAPSPRSFAGRATPSITPSPSPSPSPTFVRRGVPVAVWERLAECESHGQWHYNPATADWGNRLHEGGLQYAPATWDAFAPQVLGEGAPAAAFEASKGEQIAVAERVLAVQGWEAWPTCGRQLGLITVTKETP